MAVGDGYGHVKISRKVFDGDDGDRLWRERRQFSRWEAWVDMIQMAAWKPYTRLVGTTSVELGRGEFLASIRYLATRWRWSEKKVWTFLTVTIADRVTVQAESKKGNIYLLVNYEAYQTGGNSKETVEKQYGNKEEAIKQLSNTNTSPTDLLFDAVWHDYPKKEGKKAAKKAWDSLVARQVDLKVVEAGVYRYAAHLKAKHTERRFIKNLSTFLNGECWTDEYGEPGGMPVGENVEVDAVKSLIKAGGSLVFNPFSREQAFAALAEKKPVEWAKYESIMRKLDYGDLKSYAEQRNGYEYGKALEAQIRAISNAA